ncbi:MAG: hypothetical protein IVW53_13265 [Chloroflexi bacterium]|nr:hypothetical protein [Chloroflexota bacterium]
MTAARLIGRRSHRRPLSALLAVVLLTAILAVSASVAQPLRITCAAGGVAGQACDETVTAALERGLAPFHPLILAAHVEPGPAADPGQNGQRATVIFELLGIPGPTTVRLFSDVGGHWGGVPDRGALELGASSLLVAGVVGVAVISLALAVAAGLAGSLARRRCV